MYRFHQNKSAFVTIRTPVIEISSDKIHEIPECLQNCKKGKRVMFKGPCGVDYSMKPPGAALDIGLDADQEQEVSFFMVRFFSQ